MDLIYVTSQCNPLAAVPVDIEFAVYFSANVYRQTRSFTVYIIELNPQQGVSLLVRVPVLRYTATSSISTDLLQPTVTTVVAMVVNIILLAVSDWPFSTNPIQSDRIQTRARNR